MFVLGGVALIALPFSSIVAALASIIGLPTLVLNIFSLAIGVCAFLKGGISFTRLSSIIEFLLAN